MRVLAIRLDAQHCYRSALPGGKPVLSNDLVAFGRERRGSRGNFGLPRSRHERNTGRREKQRVSVLTEYPRWPRQGVSCSPGRLQRHTAPGSTRGDVGALCLRGTSEVWCPPAPSDPRSRNLLMEGALVRSWPGRRQGAVRRCREFSSLQLWVLDYWNPFGIKV